MATLNSFGDREDYNPLKMLYWNTELKLMCTASNIDLSGYSSRGVIHGWYTNDVETLAGQLEGYSMTTKTKFIKAYNNSLSEVEISSICQCHLCYSAREISCIGCGKTPVDISEYKGEDMPPKEFVIYNEGTLGKFAPDKFYCTTCYIKAGMPTTPKKVLRKGPAILT